MPFLFDANSVQVAATTQAKSIETTVDSKVKPNPFMVTVPSHNYTGLKILEFESSGTKLSKAEIDSAKQAYADLVGVVLETLSEMGLDKKAKTVWTEKNVVETWSEISSIIWSNFTYSPIHLLLDSFDQLAKKGSGKAQLDCDTSALLVADIFTQLGLECWICSGDEHGILKVKSGKGDVWLETTVDHGDLMNKLALFFVSFDHYHSKQGAVEALGGYHEEKFGETMSRLYYVRGLVKFNRGDYDSAITDYNEAIILDPNYVSAYNRLGIAESYLGHHKSAIEHYNMAIQLDPDYHHAYHNRGNAKNELDDQQGAQKDWKKADGLEKKLKKP